jgi:hypothetical protein
MSFGYPTQGFTGFEEDEDEDENPETPMTSDPVQQIALRPGKGFPYPWNAVGLLLDDEKAAI